MSFSARRTRTNKASSENEASRSFSRPSQFAHHLPVHPLLELQRSIGNQATERLLRARLEGNPSVSPVHPVPPSPGEPLGNAARSYMERRFGHDFSKVRVHKDEQATESARALNARAYTFGQHIVFGEGQYTLDTLEGKRLLAHELTHVVQQDDGTQTPDAITPNADNNALSDPGDATEHEAESVAAKIVSRDASHPIIRGKSSGQVQRVVPVVGGAVTTGEAIGAAVGIASIARDHWGNTDGGLRWSSDQLTYPRDLERVPQEAVHLPFPAIEFLSRGHFVDNQTIFHLHGDFAPGVMANVYFTLYETTDYTQSELSFKAMALHTAYGTKEDPRIQFVCEGNFNPAGSGKCGYRVVLEVGSRLPYVRVVEGTPKITSGEGEFREMVSTGVGSNVRGGPGIQLQVAEFLM